MKLQVGQRIQVVQDYMLEVVDPSRFNLSNDKPLYVKELPLLPGLSPEEMGLKEWREKTLRDRGILVEGTFAVFVHGLRRESAVEQHVMWGKMKIEPGVEVVGEWMSWPDKKLLGVMEVAKIGD